MGASYLTIVLLLASSCGRIAFDPFAGDDQGDGGPNDGTDAVDGGPGSAPAVTRAFSFGSTQMDFATSVAVTASDILVAGYIQGPTDFGAGSVAPSGTQDAFLARYGPANELRFGIPIGGNMSDNAQSVVVDAAGNAYVVGPFQQRITLATGNLMSAGADDCYVISYGPTGVPRWGAQIGGTMAEWCSSVEIDSAGNVYVFGTFEGTATFGDGNATSAGGKDLFIASYTSGGAHRFTRRYGGTGSEYDYQLSLSPSGDVMCIAGSLQGTVSFGGAALTSTGTVQAMLACFDTATGAHRFSRLIGGSLGPTSYSEATGLGIDAGGNVYVVGYLGDTGMFDLGAGSQPCQLDDAYLVSYDPNGAYRFSKLLGGVSYDYSWAVHVGAGGVYVLAEFEQTVDVGAGPLGGTTYWGGLVAYAFDGTLRWARDLGESELWDLVDFGTGLAGVGGVFGTVDFGTGPLTTGGANDPMVVQFDGQ